MSDQSHKSPLQAEGVRVHYRMWGVKNRPAMVLLHASGCHSGWWSEVAPMFARDYYVVAPDFRGHGSSDHSPNGDYDFDAYVADLATLLSALDLRSVLLVGHSMGGYVALRYAATPSNVLSGLVIADMLCDLKGDVLERLQQAASRPQPIFATREEAESRFRLQPPETLASSERVRMLAHDAVCQTQAGDWTFCFDRRALRHSPVNAWDLAPRVVSPTLVIRGENSTLMPLENAERLAREVRKGEWTQLPGAYHNLMLDDPRGFARAVSDWAQRSDAPERTSRDG